jgi:hypothetical protein
MQSVIIGVLPCRVRKAAGIKNRDGGRSFLRFTRDMGHPWGQPMANASAPTEVLRQASEREMSRSTEFVMRGLDLLGLNPGDRARNDAELT